MSSFTTVIRLAADAYSGYAHTVFRPCYPYLKNLKFRDFNEDYETIMNRWTLRYERSKQAVDQRATNIAEAYARNCRMLKEVYMSYELDARKLFKAIQGVRGWDSIHTLVLTSPCLTFREPASEVSLCLRQGAKAALRMPKLQKMVLWNGKRGEACAFTYSRRESCLRWRSTWPLEIEHDVVKAWDEVFPGNRSSTLRVHQEEIDSGDILSHGDAIYHLKLPEGVVDKMSLQKIRRDARPADWLSP